MSEEIQEFQNKNVSVVMTCGPDCKRTFNICITPKATEVAYKKALKSINKEISVPGFRKGHAPEKFVTERFSKEVEGEWKNIVTNTAFNEAMNLSKVQPFSNNVTPEHKLEKCSREEGATLVISFETAPDLSSIDFTKITLAPIEKKAIEEADIEKRINEVRHIFADWEEITDRPVEEGDYVDLDIHVTEVDSTEEDGKEGKSIAKDMRFKVAAEEMGDWMRELIVGASLGDTVQGTSEQDDKLKEEETAFTPSKCKLTVKKISTSTLPEIDSEGFLKNLGLADVDALKEKVEEELLYRQDIATKEKQIAALKDQLVETFQFDLPSLIVNERSKSRLASLLEQKKNEGQTAEEIESNMEAIKEENIDFIKRQLRFSFLLHKIGEENKVTVSKDEVIQEYQRQSTLGNQNGESIIHPSMEPQEIYNTIQLHILEAKALSLFVEKLTETHKA